MSAQDVIVALIAAGALAWLVVRQVRARRKKDAACANCPAGTPIEGVRAAPQPQILLGIEEPQRKSRDPR